MFFIIPLSIFIHIYRKIPIALADTITLYMIKMTKDSVLKHPDKMLYIVLAHVHPGNQAMIQNMVLIWISI